MNDSPELNDAQQLARLRVAAVTEHLPADLGLWALRTLAVLLPTARRRARDLLLREAAQAIGGSPWRQARGLQAALEGRPGPGVSGHVQGLVREAQQQARCPSSVRQLLRLVA